MSGGVIVTRSFFHELRVHCTDDALRERMAFVAAEPEMEPAPDKVIDIRPRRYADGHYALDHEGRELAGNADHMVDAVHLVLRHLMVAEAGARPVLHGASLLVEGRRLVLCAAKGCGKTTLMLKALEAGMRIEGDEHVLVRETDVLARPRTMRVKAGSLAHVPTLAARIAAAPRIESWDGGTIYAVAPSLAGAPWRVAPGPVQGFVVLEPNHGGLTLASRLDRDRAFGTLLKHTFLPSQSRVRALASLHACISATPCWKMRIGDLDRAVWSLRNLARSG